MKKALFALSFLAVVSMVQATKAVDTPAQKNIFSKGFDVVANGASSVKNSTVKSVVFVKDGVFHVYDAVTGKIEAFTPSAILNLRDSVRGTIANYPLTAMALAAFVAVNVSNYFSNAQEDEDYSF